MDNLPVPELKEIAIADIIFPPEEMRSAVDFEKLEELAKSIRSQGLMNPISVRELNGKYELIAGFRRTKATEMCGSLTILARIFKSSDDSALLKKAHENLFREDVNPLDEANYYRIMIQKQNYQLGQLSLVTHKSPAYLTRRLNLLEMPQELQDAVKDNQINVSIAEELKRITDKNEMLRLLFIVVKNGATVDTVRQWRVQFEMSSMLPPVPYTDNIAKDNEGHDIDVTKPFAVDNVPGPNLELNETIKETRICHFCLNKSPAELCRVLVACQECLNKMMPPETPLEVIK